MAINPTTTDNVELETADRTDLINKFEALERLLENPDFKVVVLEGYLKDRAIDQVSLLADPRMAANRAQLFEGLAGISHLEQYFRMIQALGAPAKEEAEEELE